MRDPPFVWVNDGKPDVRIARFVVEGDPFVNALAAEAADELRILTGGKHNSFAAVTQTGSPDLLALAVEALYLHLMADHPLRYEYELAFDVTTGEQRVQPPGVTVQTRKG